MRKISNMPRIHFLPDNKKVEIKEGETILDASLRAAIPHAHACGGNAKCSTCRVAVLEGVEFCGPRDDKAKELAKKLQFKHTVRLACQTRPTGDIKVRRLVLDELDIRMTNMLDKGSFYGAIGSEKKAAILFADIRGFTSFASEMLAYDVVHVLNRYFFEMENIIFRNGGYIDNYMGDGLLAIFGMDDSDDAALKSVTSGIEMLIQMKRFNEYVTQLFKKTFQISTGINYGSVVYGQIGGSRNKRETIVGDAVNFASRIEAFNKEFETELLISHRVYEQVKKRVQIGRHFHSELRGKSGEYDIYEVLALTK